MRPAIKRIRRKLAREKQLKRELSSYYSVRSTQNPLPVVFTTNMYMVEKRETLVTKEGMFAALDAWKLADKECTNEYL